MSTITNKNKVAIKQVTNEKNTFTRSDVTFF